MILSVIVLSLLVMQASLTTQKETDTLLKYEQLYQNFILGLYDTAATMTVELKNEGSGDVIRLIVNKLVDKSQRNLVDYAYKLVRRGKTDIVSIYFPIQLYWILTGKEIMFISRRDNMALKLAWNTDGDGDRGAFGGINEWNNDRMAWKIIPHWFKGSRAFFEIVNVHFNQYLKLEARTDGDGDRRAFGVDHNGIQSHLWYFHPVLVAGETMFYIFNRQYDLPLKLARHVDGDGDRRVWGHNGYVLGDPDRYAWRVKPHSVYKGA